MKKLYQQRLMIFQDITHSYSKNPLYPLSIKRWNHLESENDKNG